MTDRPRNLAGYRPEHVQNARRACLSLATILGDLLDRIVIVGGLVPSLLIPRERSEEEGLGDHAGTIDLDVGLSIGLLDDGGYQEIQRRLKHSGFHPDRSDDGNPVHQRWVAGELGVTVDFLIPMSGPDDEPGRLRHLEENFAAILTPGLELAFRQRKRVRLEGPTHNQELAKRSVWVCDAGPFVLLKALAVDGRAEPKDAYDLYYVVREYPGGVDAVAARIRELWTEPMVENAIDVLERDFATAHHVGPKRVAQFLGDPDSAEILEDVVGFVQRLVRGARR